jgi:antitoxin CcdA
MIKYKAVEIIKEVAVSKECDICHTVYNMEKDEWECQEFYHLKHHTGYSSVFGDCQEIELDICQHCLSNLIEKYVV